MNPGDVFAVSNYPFVRVMASTYDVDGLFTFLSWKPGTVGRLIYPDDAEAIAHGVGCMTMQVVSIHKPGKYPERVFYVRQWINPDGVPFGKTKLRITTATQFKRLAAGYAYEFRVSEPEMGEVA